MPRDTPVANAEHRRRRVVIAGGTGFLGVNLARHLAQLDYDVTLISRHAPRQSGAWDHATWDGRSLGQWRATLNGAAALVNLVGRTVDCVKTPDHCDEILRSRIDATRVLGQALREVASPPPVWVQMSTAHIYGDPPDAECTEDSTLGYGFAPIVGQAWESAFSHSALPGTRGVVLRTSFVLGRSGGALPRLARLAAWRLGGTVGRGTQGMSWIHEQDMNRLFVRAIENGAMSGMYIASAPEPVSNAVFMRELRHAMGVRLGLPAPSPMVRIGAFLLLRADPELALYGRYCRSIRLRDDGFEFQFPDITSALGDLFSR